MLFFALLGAANLPYQGNVSWDDIRATEGCFFFSGPLELGRDDHLGAEASIASGPTMTVAFGPHTFRGPRGEPMVRESSHDFHGAWVVRESLRGTWSADGFAGSYRYQERGKSDDDWGRCAITAHVSIRSE